MPVQAKRGSLGDRKFQIWAGKAHLGSSFFQTLRHEDKITLKRRHVKE
jgi:hypothetical protein